MSIGIQFHTFIIKMYVSWGSRPATYVFTYYCYICTIMQWFWGGLTKLKQRERQREEAAGSYLHKYYHIMNFN